MSDHRRGPIAALLSRLNLDPLKRLLSSTLLYGELDRRLQLDESLRQQAAQLVPDYAARRLWCMGGIAFLLILNQLLTGLLLLVYYQPGSNTAFVSMRYLMEAVPLGWLFRQMHAWGSHLLVLAVIIHMFKVFLTGAFRPPRELNWVVGTVLFLLTFAFAFTGHLLPWDQTSYWSTALGSEHFRALPLVGDAVLHLLRGGGTVTDATLARFFTIHVVLLPWIMTLGLVGHFVMIRRQGISKPL